MVAAGAWQHLPDGLRLPGGELDAHNTSEGCGGIMRVAPVAARDMETAFDLGSATARLTHGYPSGYSAQGSWPQPSTASLQARPSAKPYPEPPLLKAKEGHGEVLSAVEAALQLAMGGGWVGEEALAVGLYCALAVDSFEDALVLAVNHSGDSDSSGSIAGQIMGARHGLEAIPERWLTSLELRVEH